MKGRWGPTDLYDSNYISNGMATFNYEANRVGVFFRQLRFKRSDQLLFYQMYLRVSYKVVSVLMLALASLSVI